MLWNKNIRKYTKSYNGFSIFDYYIPLIRYYGMGKAKKEALSLALLNKEKKPFRNFGYNSSDISWNDDLENAKAKNEFYKIEFNNSTINLLKQFLSECQNKKISIVFVYVPEYIEGQKYIQNHKELISLYKEIASDYNIPFFNYSKDSLSFKKKYFYNSLHLNKTGAELFSKKLAQNKAITNTQ